MLATKIARFPGSIPNTLIQIPWVSIRSPLVGSAKHVVPPVSLVKKVILHVCLCRGRGILVVPYWPSALYWPLLVERGGVFKSFVADCLYVENGKDVFLYGGRVPFLGRRGCMGICTGCCGVVRRLVARPLGQFTTNALVFAST